MSTSEGTEGAEVIRSEEELAVGREPYVAGSVRVRKEVETEHVEEDYLRDVEHIDGLGRVPVEDGDSGEVETLPDGSVSIPVLEERLVVSKQIFVRERVIVRKRTVTESERVQAELRRERVDIEGAEQVD